VSAPTKVRTKAAVLLEEFVELFETWIKADELQNVPDVLAVQVLEYSTLHEGALQDIGRRIDQIVADNNHPPKAAGIKKLLAEKCTTWTRELLQRENRRAYKDKVKKLTAEDDLDL
jgi:hypothetical protein